jgi:hypothetical protein
MLLLARPVDFAADCKVYRCATLTIGEVADRAGINAAAVRDYERIGVLPAASRLVHASPVEIGARGSHELGDEHEHVVVVGAQSKAPRSSSVQPSRGMFDP